MDSWIYASMVLIYFALNVIGTVYYMKLKDKTHRSVGLLTVLFGWTGMPLINLYSPITYEHERV